MHLDAAVLASVSKHAIAGIIAVVAGVVIVAFGAVRIGAKVAGATILPLVGLVVLVLGVLLWTRTI